MTHGSRELRSMRKQIVRGFHSLKGKINKAFGQGREYRRATKEPSAKKTDSGQREVGGTGQKAPVQAVDRSEFELLVNTDLSENLTRGWLFVADVDRFREVADLYGQDTGEAVLDHVADVLLDAFAGVACMVRLGRDAYAMWLPDGSTVQAERLFRQACEVNDLLLHPEEGFPPVTLSIGMVLGDAAEDCRSLGRKAVKALNYVKESGRCGCRIYDGREDVNARPNQGLIRTGEQAGLEI